MKDKTRPFTFTYLRKENYLEFMIKIYKEHQGVPNMLGRINARKESIIYDVWTTIECKEPRGFIAGGAHITPFISIFRNLCTIKSVSANASYTSIKL
ncbi:hypothetical protein [Flavobacterium sp. ALD4]|uniref:hypothetical protein n=1 Tax=Flavobacterium sp. ALD4 TaxID=2058314 RepID=UPI0012FF3F47|nr:hypothetical protein [Flavobacterium sp. ALD4]